MRLRSSILPFITTFMSCVGGGATCLPFLCCIHADMPVFVRWLLPLPCHYVVWFVHATVFVIPLLSLPLPCRRLLPGWWFFAFPLR